MSDIYSKEIEEVVTRRRLKVTGIKCDCCDKEIPALPLNRVVINIITLLPDITIGVMTVVILG